MKSYKNWKLLNESIIPGMTLGLSHPQTVGLQSALPGFSLDEKKKMHGDVVADEEPEDVVDDESGDDDEDDVDHECSCKHKKKKPDVAFSKKKCGKKMKKRMEDDFEGDEDDDHDVNKVDVPDDEDHDEEDVDHDDEDHDDEDHDEEDGDEDHDEEDVDHDEDDDEGEEYDDSPKFGFMKDKKKQQKKEKEKKKQKKVEEQFWQDIKSYNVPSGQEETEKEFFDSLTRQYGNPFVRYNGGVDSVNEDLLLSADQQELIDSMPKPGDVGFGPSQRLGGNFASSEAPDLDYVSYGENYDSVEDSDYEVLCKYLSEDVARQLIERKRS